MELMPLLAMGKQIIAWVVQQAGILGAQGDITPEQVAAIKAEAQLSDSDWDSAVAAAKARIAAGELPPGSVQIPS